jgi:hypothetical protein
MIVSLPCFSKHNNEFVCSDFEDHFKENFECITDTPFYVGKTSIAFNLKGKNSYHSIDDYILKINLKPIHAGNETKTYKAISDCPYMMKVI